MQKKSFPIVLIQYTVKISNMRICNTALNAVLSFRLKIMNAINHFNQLATTKTAHQQTIRTAEHTNQNDKGANKTGDLVYTY
jgi:hypothetical protein